MKNMYSVVKFSKFVGSVRIQLLFLKTWRWKHGSKIIFKWVDSAVIPVFIIFFLNKVVVGPVNSALFLLHSESTCMNSAVTIHMRWKRKKKKKSETKNVDARYTECNSCTVNPCASIVQLLFVRAEKKKKRKKETWNWERRGARSQMQTATLSC